MLLPLMYLATVGVWRSASSLPSTLRLNIISSIQLRMQTLGYRLTPGEISAIVSDAQAQVAADANAQADAIADIAQFPSPPQVLGG